MANKQYDGLTEIFDIEGSSENCSENSENMSRKSILSPALGLPLHRSCKSTVGMQVFLFEKGFGGLLMTLKILNKSQVQFQCPFSSFKFK